MKIKLMVSGLLVTLFCSTSLVAQEGPSVLRTWNCSVNSGFTMSEVAAFASLSTGPKMWLRQRFFREAVAIPGEYQRDFDFQWADYYASWDDYIQTRVAQRNRQAQEAP